MAQATSASSKSSADRNQIILWAALAALTVAVVIGFLNTLRGTWEKWENPQYSHGYLVPVFALVLLYFRKRPIPEIVPAWQRWLGVGVLGLSLAVRVLTAWLALVIPEMLTLVPALMGLVLIIGGIDMFKWSWPAIAFLFFMFPLPDVVERRLLDPLQHTATVMSTFALQTLGFSAYNEGNRIQLGELQMGVVDACSGLRMITIFFALATGITLMTDRPWWERIVIVLSAFPIALLVNVIRITVTGILYTINKELGEKVFHDFAGWVMMPLALGFLYVELQVLSNLFVEEQDASLEMGLKT